MKSVLLGISVLVNLVLAVMLLFTVLDGCAEISDGKLGVLTQDIRAGVFGTENVVLTLPRGLVVRDASATGAGRFEPHRFKIVVTTEDPGVVDYTPVSPASGSHGEFYSADIPAQDGSDEH